MECLYCHKPVEQVKGKRKRLYCNDSCKVKYWKKGTMKVEIVASVPDDKELEILRERIKELENRKTDGGVNSEILSIIEAVKKNRDEKIPPERNTHLGKKVWEQEIDKEFNKLLNKLFTFI